MSFIVEPNPASCISLPIITKILVHKAIFSSLHCFSPACHESCVQTPQFLPFLISCLLLREHPTKPEQKSRGLLISALFTTTKGWEGTGQRQNWQGNQLEFQPLKRAMQPSVVGKAEQISRKCTALSNSLESKIRALCCLALSVQDRNSTPVGAITALMRGANLFRLIW